MTNLCVPKQVYLSACQNEPPLQKYSNYMKKKHEVSQPTGTIPNIESVG